jgi:hypothetical protein
MAGGKAERGPCPLRTRHRPYGGAPQGGAVRAAREAHENSGCKATQCELSSGTVSPRFVPSQRSASGRTRKASGNGERDGRRSFWP